MKLKQKGHTLHKSHVFQPVLAQ